SGVDAVEDVRQIAAAHETHREIEAALAVEPELVDRDDSAMVELAGQTRLFEEAGASRIRAARCGSRAILAHPLDRERPAQLRVPGPQDDAHAAAPELALDDVALEGPGASGETLEKSGLAPPRSRTRVRVD